MNNGEVKRWTILKVADDEFYLDDGERPDSEYSEIKVMPVEDHERIVAELNARLNKVNSVFKMWVSENETIAELRAEVERLKQVRKRQTTMLINAISLRDDTIASQKRVIDRFRQSINDLIIYVDSDADSFGDRYWPTRNTLIAMLKETTAIENQK